MLTDSYLTPPCTVNDARRLFLAVVVVCSKPSSPSSASSAAPSSAANLLRLGPRRPLRRRPLRCPLRRRLQQTFFVVVLVVLVVRCALVRVCSKPSSPSSASSAAPSSAASSATAHVAKDDVIDWRCRLLRRRGRGDGRRRGGNTPDAPVLIGHPARGRGGAEAAEGPEATRRTDSKSSEAARNDDAADAAPRHCESKPLGA